MVRWDLRLVWLTMTFALAASACTSDAASPTATEGQELTVFAAASLRHVFEDLESAWSTAQPDIELRLAFDGSNVLATQISEGAPADVFISADTEWPDRLAAEGLTAAYPVILLGNAIAIVTPSAGSAVATLADLGRAGVRIVGTAPGVPITRYAEQVIEAIARTMPDDPDFRTRVAANVVSREDNVRLALAKVELGEGDAAIVYLTDAMGSTNVRQLPVPDGARIGADYAVVQISQRDAAVAFVEWLGGPEASAVFTSAGFELRS